MANYLVRLNLSEVQEKLKRLNPDLIAQRVALRPGSDEESVIRNRVDKMTRALCKEVTSIIKMFVDYTAIREEESKVDEGDKYQDQLAFQFYDKETKKVVDI